MRRPVLRAVFCLFAMLAVGACVSGPRYLFNQDGNADFSSYRTFGFFDERDPRRSAYQSVAHRRLKSAIVREMLALGYRRSEQPELLVNIHLQRRDGKTAEAGQDAAGASGYYSYRNGQYAWRAGVATVSGDYTEGTLNIDVVDLASRALLWEGIAVGSVSQRMYENLESTIDSVVARLFERFPRSTAPGPLSQVHWSGVVTFVACRHE